MPIEPTKCHSRTGYVREKIESLSYAKMRSFAGVKGFSFADPDVLFCVQPLMIGSYLLSATLTGVCVCVCVFWFLGLEFRNHKSIDAFDDAFLLHRNDLLALKTHRQYSNASRLHNALPKKKKKKNKKLINWLHCTGRKA